MNFCHLHLHTEYSLLDGLGTAKEYAQRAQELGFKYLGCTDHGNIDGHIRFQRACKEHEIIPIFGCESYIISNRFDKQKEFRGHVTIWVQNEEGWKSLCRMLSKANLEGFYYKPRIDAAMLREHIKHSSGLIFGTACASTFLRASEDVSDLFLEMIDANIPTYLEIMPHKFETQEIVNKMVDEVKQFAPLLATNDCHYILEEDWESQEVLMAIQTKARWKDPERFRFQCHGLHLRSYKEMVDAFEDQGFWGKSEYLGALRNTIKVAKSCEEFELKQQTISLPSPPIKRKIQHDSKGWASESVQTVDQMELETKVWEGLENVLPNEMGQDDYVRQIKHELKIIEEKGFARYFLIVLDLIEWCGRNNIRVGPGRGSVGGSLVAYCLGITQVDPLRYGLVFERFISADRVDWPDIDIDVEDRKRDLVKKYLESTYGEGCVAGVSTFGRMKGKAVIRDVARVFDVPLDEVDEFAKGIEYTDDNKGTTVEDHANGEGKSFRKKWPRVVRHAAVLEGKIRHASQHAAAVIVSPEKIEDTGKGVLCRRKNEILINWDMEDSEFMGLIKLDILGLNTLSVISACLELIEGNHGEGFFWHPESDAFFFGKIGEENEELTPCLSSTKDAPNHFPLNDMRVFDMLSEGNTVGVFQWGTWAMTKLAQELKPRNFEDMAAAIALVRPGPADSGITEQYVERRHGASWDGETEEYNRITCDTLGLIVYQEQVMTFLHTLAGMTLSEADKIRKILAKKRDPKELEPYKEKFLEGVENVDLITLGQGKRFWDDLKNHAHYSFNRAHSVEYALIGYWTAWLKLHYPTEFICASLSYGRESQKDELLKEAGRLGLSILPPKVGRSSPFAWSAEDNTLVCPFIEIKGIGESTASQCVVSKQAKRAGFFKDDKSAEIKNKKVREILLEVNAFDPEGNLPQKARDLFDFAFPDSAPIEPPALKRRRYRANMVSCERCDLREECRKPIMTDLGIYNAMILGEAPGRMEDKIGKAFKGPAGKKLWEEIEAHGWARRHFHVANTCRCYPSRTKTPKPEHISPCFRWLDEEIENLDTPIILALGNVPLQALTGEKGGIMKKCGTTEYLSGLNAWVCWGIHPSAVLRNETKNLPLFREGVENFIQTLEG